MATRVADGLKEIITVNKESLATYLGPQKFFNEIALRTSLPGVATGLAWTPFGGDILFIEATKMPGDGKLLLTGQLGDVMKESAQAALSLVKSRAETLGIDPGYLQEERLAHSYSRGRDPERRSQRWSHAVCRSRLTSDWTANQQRCRHDGRDQSARFGAPGRRNQREDAGSKKSGDFLFLWETWKRFPGRPPGYPL